jgi:hypothetical protein
MRIASPVFRARPSLIDPPISIALKAIAAAAAGTRTLRRSHPAAQAAAAIDATHVIRKLVPHVPVTDASWSKGPFPTWV